MLEYLSGKIKQKEVEAAFEEIFGRVAADLTGSGGKHCRAVDRRRGQVAALR